jgi:single-strand DNA-binding protein
LINRVILIGRLTADPTLKFMPGDGKGVCNFTLAVERNFKNANGERDADFVPIVVWGKTAESSANYLNKGKLASVSGRIQTRHYEAKEGHRVYVTEVIADEVQFLEWDKKPVDGEINNQSNTRTAPPSNTPDYTEVPVGNEDDIPF